MYCQIEMEDAVCDSGKAQFIIRYLTKDCLILDSSSGHTAFPSTQVSPIIPSVSSSKSPLGLRIAIIERLVKRSAGQCSTVNEVPASGIWLFY